jgi:hypothetical protein
MKPATCLLAWTITDLDFEQMLLSCFTLMLQDCWVFFLSEDVCQKFLMPQYKYVNVYVSKVLRVCMGGRRSSSIRHPVQILSV